MTWTTDKPMSTWVFDTGGLFYASRMAPHEPANIAKTQRLTNYPGKWWGPVEVPD